MCKDSWCFSVHSIIKYAFMNRLLIIGAAGELGKSAARFFVNAGFEVRAFVRTREKASIKELEGAEIFLGDLTDHNTHAEACKNVDVVLTAAHGMLGKGKNRSQNIDELAHKNLIDTCYNAGVRHFIYTSVAGVGPDHPIDFYRRKYAVEEYLKSSGLTYSILRLPAFMEWHVHNLLGKSIQEKGKVLIFGSGANPTNFLAVEDLVSALNKIFLNPAYLNKTITIAGPENISRNQVASLYGRVLQLTPRTRHVPLSAIKFLAPVIGTFHPGMGRVMRLAIHTDSSDETLDTNSSIKQFGLEPTTVEAFIRKKLKIEKEPEMFV
jgi:uncharacterized protein YbjT (DUF2867 family)